jgi:putative addiction module component (TIGR02574 family)
VSDTLREIEKQVRYLSVEERAILAEILLESLREPPIATIEEAWDQEIERRLAALERGELETVSAESLFVEARPLGH